MRLIALFMLAVGSVPCLVSPLAAQLPAEGRIVALDIGSAKLLKSCCPETAFESLIQSKDESHQVLNSRAWSMRDISCLIYRGDQLSLKARLFRERLTAQGVRSIDLAAYARKQRPAPRGCRIADGEAQRAAEQESFIMSLAVEQFCKVTTGF